MERRSSGSSGMQVHGLHYFLIVVLAVSFLCVFGTVCSAEVETPQNEVVGRPDFVDLVKKIAPSVVNIRTVKVVQNDGSLSRHYNGPESPWPRDFFGDDFLDRFFGGPPGGEHKERSLGSGFIISKDGYLLTNNHVVEGAEKIKVILSDGKELAGEIIGKDAKIDIALVKVQAEGDLPVAELGNSDAVEVGEWVMAIGNPFGLDHTVTVGVVSAKGRVIGAGPYDDFIQTDASINPGNSGGPLLNTKGDVIGINSAIIAHGQGIGFAIPINMVNEVIGQLKEKGRVVRGWLGVIVQKVTPELASSFGLDSARGALVGQVVEDGPAEKAGVKKGDIILQFGDDTIDEMNDLPRVVAATPVGKKVPVVVYRDGKKKTLTVKIGELPEDDVMPREERQEKNFGMTVQDLTPELASRLGYPDDEEGVIVSSVEPNGPAAEAGMRRGDVIKEVNRKKVTSTSAFTEIMDGVAADENMLLFVKRGEDTLYVVLKQK